MKLASCLGGAILSSSSTIVLFPARRCQKDPHGGGALPALTRLVGQGMCGNQRRMRFMPCELASSILADGELGVDVEQSSHLCAAELMVLLHAAALT
jgi:hypothetical protein